MTKQQFKIKGFATRKTTAQEAGIIKLKTYVDMENVEQDNMNLSKLKDSNEDNAISSTTTCVQDGTLAELAEMMPKISGFVANNANNIKTRNQDTMYTKVFIGGLAYSTTDEKLVEFFSQFGEVEEAVIIMDRVTGNSKGYGFVIMCDKESAAKAVADPNPAIDGRKVNVNLAYLGTKPRSNVGSYATTALPGSSHAPISVVPVSRPAPGDVALPSTSLLAPCRANGLYPQQLLHSGTFSLQPGNSGLGTQVAVGGPYDVSTLGTTTPSAVAASAGRPQLYPGYDLTSVLNQQSLLAAGHYGQTSSLLSANQSHGFSRFNPYQINGNAAARFQSLSYQRQLVESSIISDNNAYQKSSIPTLKTPTVINNAALNPIAFIANHSTSHKPNSLSKSSTAENPSFSCKSKLLVDAGLDSNVSHSGEGFDVFPANSIIKNKEAAQFQYNVFQQNQLQAYFPASSNPSTQQHPLFFQGYQHMPTTSIHPTRKMTTHPSESNKL